MLDCETQEVWDSTYVAATAIIAHGPKRQSELDKIYQHPMYYSCWYLNDIDGLFDSKGSTPEKQNHAHIVRHLDNRGNFSIAEYLKLLIERQVRQGKARSENEMRSHQLQRSFKSQKPSVKGMNYVLMLNSLQYQEKLGQNVLSFVNSNGDDDEKIEETISCVSHTVSPSMEIQISNSTDSNDVKVMDTRELAIYQSLLSQCEVPLWLIQHDKSKMAHFSDVTTCIKKARNDLPIKVSFGTSNIDLKEDMVIIERGRLSAAPNAANMKQLKSCREKRMSCAIANKRMSYDDKFCISNIKNRTCALCGSK
eukprot:13936531-Ditylum_brightwellii.AAC.1